MTKVKGKVMPNWDLIAERLQRGLLPVALVLLLVDLVIHKHGHFHHEEWFGFYGWFALAACVGMVVIASVWRFIVQREEDYYDG